MKIIVVSDIHGNSEKFKIVMNFMKQEQIDKMIILGDIFNNYYELNAASKEISSMLWEIPSKLAITKGNCDNSFDQTLLPVNFLDHFQMVLGTKRIYFHHGHLRTLYSDSINVYCQGHTHVAKIQETDGIIYMNPGSISMPRDYTCGTFLVMNESVITIFDLNFNVIYEKNISR